MITVEQKEVLRRAILVDRRSIREVAQEHHVSRKTIRKALHDASPPIFHTPALRPHPVVGPVETWIDQVLEADRSVHRKQRHTALRIWERLCAEKEFTGGESTIRGYVRAWKRAHGAGPKVFIPIEHPPGRDGEGDWGEAEAIIGGARLVVQFFVLRLSASGKAFVMAFPHQRQEAFFAAHVAAFAFLGGIPEFIRYDNLRVAVAKVLRGHQRQEQEAFIAFRSHHLYKSSFCTPGEQGAHEKGGVENGVGYARRHFFVPLPVADSFADLNAQLFARLVADGRRIPKGKTESIDAAFAREQPLLQTLPRYPYDCCRRVEARVNSCALVTFESNRYSVPVGFAFRLVSVKAYVHELHIASDDAVVARHPRLYGQGGDALDPLHYVPILHTRPAALDLGKPFQGWALPEAFGRLRTVAGVRVLIRVLQEIPTHGLDAVRAAVERALAGSAPTSDAVLRHLDAGRQPVRLDISSRPDLASVSVPVVSCARYNHLLS